MDFNELLKEKKLSKYKISKLSGVPYSTVSDICSGKSIIPKCSSETVVRLAHVLSMTAEELVGEIEYPVLDEKPEKTVEEKEAKKTSKSGKTSKKKSEKKTDKESSKKEKSEVKSDSTVSEKNNKNSDEIIREWEALKDERAKKKEEAYKKYVDSLSEKIRFLGELDFLVTYLKNNEVEIMYNLNRIKESKYLLALIDDLCVKYEFPFCKEYDYIRNEEL